MRSSGLEIYEAISAESCRMLDAVLAADRNALTEAGLACVALVERARRSRAPALGPAQRLCKHEIILAILLARDAEIRDRASPCLATLEALLGGRATADVRVFADSRGTPREQRRAA